MGIAFEDGIQEISRIANDIFLFGPGVVEREESVYLLSPKLVELDGRDAKIIPLESMGDVVAGFLGKGSKKGGLTPCQINERSAGMGKGLDSYP